MANNNCRIEATGVRRIRIGFRYRYRLTWPRLAVWQIQVGEVGPMRREGFVMKKLIVVAMLTSVYNFAAAQDRGAFQHWQFDYTGREWLKDCEQKSDQCLFFIRTVAQASFWFDKCIPDGTSMMEIADVMRTYIDKNLKYIDSPATSTLLTAMHVKWKCKK